MSFIIYLRKIQKKTIVNDYHNGSNYSSFNQRFWWQENSMRYSKILGKVGEIYENFRKTKWRNPENLEGYGLSKKFCIGNYLFFLSQIFFFMALGIF